MSLGSSEQTRWSRPSKLFNQMEPEPEDDEDDFSLATINEHIPPEEKRARQIAMAINFQEPSAGFDEDCELPKESLPPVDSVLAFLPFPQAKGDSIGKKRPPPAASDDEGGEQTDENADASEQVCAEGGVDKTCGSLFDDYGDSQSSDEGDNAAFDKKQARDQKSLGLSTSELKNLPTLSAFDLRDRDWEYKSGPDIWTPATNMVEPGRLQKQKHQITWLATTAAEDENKIAEMGARMRDAKRQTRAKYGW